MDVKKDSLKAWVLAARPKTLTGAAVPVMIGLALAINDLTMNNVRCSIFSVQWVPAVLCLLFAFIMQIDANFINDLFDFLKGTDDRETRLGPERACTQGWVSVRKMKIAIALTTVLSCIIGLPLIYYGGWEMIFIGIFCVLFCFLYTTHLSYMGLGDVLVLVFFGIIPVCTTYYIMTHSLTFQVVMASMACGLVIDALLFVNNFRDRDTDREAGKMTIVVRIGAEAALYCYMGVGVVACLMGLVFLLNGHWLAFVLPLFYLVLHYRTYRSMRTIWQGRTLNNCLGDTARNIFIYGLTVTIGLILS